MKDNLFIEEYWIDENTVDCLSKLCNDLNENGVLLPGKIGVNGEVNPEMKHCFEVNLSQVPPQYMEDQFVRYGLQTYVDHLREKLSVYSDKYMGGLPMCTSGPPKIQWYPPGGAYFAQHFDNGMEHDHRQVAYITYLTDHKEGGETTFIHQNHKVKPQKGKTVFFPAGYTHLHRSEPALEHRVIMTGWFQFFTALDTTPRRK